jgi:hypothetical protein
MESFIPDVPTRRTTQQRSDVAAPRLVESGSDQFGHQRTKPWVLTKGLRPDPGRAVDLSDIVGQVSARDGATDNCRSELKHGIWTISRLRAGALHLRAPRS